MEVCANHPDRAAEVTCQSCGRNVCRECMVKVAEAYVCTQCASVRAFPLRVDRSSETGYQSSIPWSGRRTRSGSSWLVRAGSLTPRTGAGLTRAILLVCVAVFGFQLLSGDRLTDAWMLVPSRVADEPGRAFTSTVLHGGIAHLVMNMAALSSLGRVLEPLLGKGRFAALYVLSGLAGSAAVVAFTPSGSTGWEVGVVGASGAIFGLFGAAGPMLSKSPSFDVHPAVFPVLLVANLAVGFVVPAVSWEAHVGGAVAGVLVGVAASYPPLQWRWLASVVALVAVFGGVAIVL